jgi:hypothetical protein
MVQAIRAKDLPEKAEMKAVHEKKKKAGAGLAVAVESFSGKVFSGLTGGEKDDLLKAVAISLGIIEE